MNGPAIAASDRMPLALESQSGVNPWVVSMAVMLATFMEVLDTSVANVALPHIAGSLSADVDASTWVLTSYFVSNAIVLPLTGWFSSLFGRKNFYLVCVTLFTLSSLMCGLAPNLETLIFFRVLQGAGGGALQPISQAILVESFPRSKQGMAMAVFGMGVVLAPIVGPTLGGWITDTYSWRWIFFINIPVGVLSVLLAAALVFDPPYLSRKPWRQIRIDYVGLGFLCLGLGCLQVFLDKGQREDWFASRFITGLTVLWVASLILFILWELRQASPVVELRLLKNRNFAIAVVAMFVLGVVLYSSTVLLPLFLQQLMGYDATLSGLVLSPGGVVVLVAMPVVGWLVAGVAARYLIVVGLIILAISLFQMASFNLQIDFATAVIARMIQGLGLAFLFIPINTAAFSSISKEKTNNATGMINLVRNIGGSAGVAFVTTMLARRAQAHQSVLVENLSPLNPTYYSTIVNMKAALMQQGAGPLQASNQAEGLIHSELLRQSHTLAFMDCFWLLAILSLAIIPLMLLVRKPAHLEKGRG